MSDQLIYNILIYRYIWGEDTHALKSLATHPPPRCLLFYSILFSEQEEGWLPISTKYQEPKPGSVSLSLYYIICTTAMWSARFRQSCESNPHLELSRSFFFLLFCETSLVINWQTLTLNSSKWVEAMSERGTWAGFRYPVLKEMPLR